MPAFVVKLSCTFEKTYTVTADHYPTAVHQAVSRFKTEAMIPVPSGGLDLELVGIEEIANENR